MKRPGVRRLGRRARFRIDNSPAELFMPHYFERKVELIDHHTIPVVYMTRKIYSQMWHIVDMAPREVGWLGIVERIPSGNFLIKEIFIVEQTVSAVETEMSEDGIAKLAQELMGRENGIDAANAIRFWGHSHVRMPAMPSGTDDLQMEKFREDGCPWFIRGILNKNGQMRFDIFLWETGVKITDAAWTMFDEVDGAYREEIAAQFKAKVTVRKPPPLPQLPLEASHASYYRLHHGQEGGEIIIPGNAENEEEGTHVG